MAKAVSPGKESSLFLVEGYIGDVKLRFMQARSDGNTSWLIGQGGETPEVFSDIKEAKAQWHFLIDLYVMKLMIDAEKDAMEKEKSDGQQ